MSDFTLWFNNILSIIILLSNVFFVLILIAFIARSSSLGKKFLNLVRRYSYHLVFLLSFGGVVGSLIYSEIVGFAPCVFCWYQRIFLYSIAILTLVALIKKEKVLNAYLLSLAIPGAIIGFYQYAVTTLGAPSLTPCTAVGGGCSLTYFINFGYITIPFMAFSAFALIAVIILVDKFLKRT
ncbi:MAG: disulfide bond formation protein B [Patescibacteria group bacterium]